MIKKLQIHNYQSHKETVLTFKPGVNVIIGPSDSGKSSIIRAIKWLIWNRPLGEAFRSHWGGDVETKINFTDCVIERLKGKKDWYKLWNDPTEPPIEFKAFGTEVPEEIRRALNLSEINVQNQMDSSFLISETPGEVSRHFNKIANIDKIDTSQRVVDRWIRELNENIRAAEGEVERLEKQLSEFEYLDKMESDLEILEQLEQTRHNKARQAYDLSKIISDVENLEEEIADKSGLLPAKPLVTQLIKLNREASEKTKRLNKLNQLARQIEEVEWELQENQELTEDEEIVNSLLQLYNKKKETESDKTGIGGLIMKIQSIDKKKAKADQKLSTLEERWHKEAPDTCPLCGGTGNLKTMQ